MRRYQYIILLLVFVCSRFYGQQKTERFFSFELTPFISSMSFNGNNPNFKPQSKLGIRYNLSYIKTIYPKIFLKTGLGYQVSNVQFSTNLNYLVENNDIVNKPSSNTTTKKASHIKAKIKHFILPIHLYFKSNEIGYTSFVSGFGIDLGIQTRSKIYTDKNDYLSANKHLSSFLTQGNLHFGLHHRISGNVSLVATINYTFSLQAITKSHSFSNSNASLFSKKGNLQHFGITTGLIF